MINRIVKMTFLPGKTGDFIEIFNQSKEKILACDGCKMVDLLNDIHQPNIFFTHSLWEEEAHLEAYRKSELFKNTWAKTKLLFQEKPQAWSLTLNSKAGY